MYARDTSVSAERTRAEIEGTLRRYGAEAFAYASKADAAMIEFQFSGKRIRFVVPMPSREDFLTYQHGQHTRERTPTQVAEAQDQACRQRWRALALVIKAKLEAVVSTITKIEEEFLAHIVLPNGQTVGQLMIPRVDEAYRTNKVPALDWERP